MAENRANIRVVKRKNGDVMILQRPKALAAQKKRAARAFAQRLATEKAQGKAVKEIVRSQKLATVLD